FDPSRNMIAGNIGEGVAVTGDDNVVAGNFIGTDVNGSTALGNGLGVLVQGQRNRIGTNGNGVADDAERNVISGNAQEGVRIVAPRIAGPGPGPAMSGINEADQNVIAGNYIGTDGNGTTALGNG